MLFILIGLAVVICLASATVIPATWARKPILATALAALGPAIGLLAMIMAAPTVLSGTTPTWAVSWIPQWDLDLALQVSPWGWFMGLIVTGIGVPLMIYGGAYGDGDKRAGRMLAMLSAFAGAMLLLVLSDHLLMIYIAWEATSVLSFLLVGYKHEKEDARLAARRALVITIAGGLSLLAGLLLLGRMGDTWLLSEMPADLTNHGLYPAALLCLVFAAATKSAQFPFHVWLPGAMAAPTPVSCYLHAATMVKAGVFLLGTLLPFMGGTALWTGVVGTIGAVTAAYAGVRLLTQDDLKGVVAWSTVSALGMMVALLGVGTPGAALAAALLVGAHATYKAGLFMMVGMVDHGTGTRSIARLGGLFKAMPLAGITAVLAALSLMGLPPFSGFVAKEYLLKAVLSGPWLITVALMIAAIGGSAAAIALTIKTFWGTPRDTSLHPHKPSLGMAIPALAIVGTGALMGILTTSMGASWQVIGEALAGEEVIKPKTFPGVDKYLAISLALAATGAAVGFAWLKLQPALARIYRMDGPGVTDWLHDLVLKAARIHTRIVVNGSLASYISVMLLIACGAISVGLLTGPYELQAPALEGHMLDPAAMILIILGALGMVVVRNRLAAAMALGALGAGMALFFLARGAPDLAFTQITVESLSVLLIILAFRALPELGPARKGTRGFWTIGVAAVFGISVGLALMMSPASTEPAIGAAFHERSWTEAFGRNVVNVILVDFRAMDTLGEVAVLALAALGLIALVRTRALGEASDNAEASPLVVQAARVLLPLFLVCGIFLLLRGHHEPGGGFIGGLAAAAGIAFVGLTHGPEARRKILGSGGRVLFGSGLVIAIFSALIPVAFGQPFFTGLWAKIPIGGDEPLKLGTPLLFDIGVFMVVVGITTLFIEGLQEHRSGTGSKSAARLKAVKGLEK